MFLLNHRTERLRRTLSITHGIVGQLEPPGMSLPAAPCTSNITLMVWWNFCLTM
jgi:hypothetical protein